ncbi:beta-ketoadipate enol-lactone hydrolase [Alkalihalobacillus alcalophilus ATCC 27647 = CGMCC 1.3604]|uniref:Beta-ketoadipate enol-lactone hydrolase n=1 Tax=Alkalihalobacillus alcalophilus ATCC 27647 = CGMCC 1.3604 TaxID=1218173 RepID=A0A4S4JZ41_ALKAL|nr:alpha/beta hydrolase [Alkalihalobacillus alcalophilus]MED1562618.1 alpha/beta hydrolase [Alkalihalobacillus alcalophilus]THG90553.1 beta-ketoadipate enol-lactone hydrolase [Alkalihalobacillus alcalophilus ATCC 27647 = CGMCC 1.3604]
MLAYTIHQQKPYFKDIVLIHGLGGNSSIFKYQLDSFKQHFNVITIELPGHGTSPNTDSYQEPFTIQIAAQEVLKTLDHLKIKEAHFVGVSLGTIVIHQLLTDAPKRVKSVVMAGALTRFNPLSRSLLTLGNAVKSFTPHLWIYKLFAHIMMPKKNHKRSRDIFIREATKMKRSDFLGWYNIVAKVESIYKGSLKIPNTIEKLYVSGSEDHLFLKPLLEDLKKDLYAKKFVINHCGHVCNIEKHREFNDVSIDFLQKQGKVEAIPKSS